MKSNNDGALRAYLNDIAQYQLLTPAAELEIARRMDDPAIAEQPKKELVEANLRLVCRSRRSTPTGVGPVS